MEEAHDSLQMAHQDIRASHPAAPALLLAEPASSLRILLVAADVVPRRLRNRGLPGMSRRGVSDRGDEVMGTNYYHEHGGDFC